MDATVGTKNASLFRRKACRFRGPRKERIMFDHGPWHSLDSTCDSPPYAIVQACRRIGVHNPEDVPWCRLDPGREGWRAEFFRLRFWTKWLANSRSGIPRWPLGTEVACAVTVTA